MRLRGWPWRLGAASWALTAVISLFWDWFLYNEDQAFHLMLTIMLPALVALGAALGQASRHSSSAAPDRGAECPPTGSAHEGDARPRRPYSA